MRVIAGIYRSRPLKGLKGLALRPTSDRLKETLFNVIHPRIEGARFLDLFAGTGAIGIEAISRGAQMAVFVEKHAAAVRLIRQNLENLEIDSGARVIATGALQGLEKLEEHSAEKVPGFDIVFLDPPYDATEEYLQVLTFLEESKILSTEGIVIAEHRFKFNLPGNCGSLTRYRLLEQGDAALSFYRRLVQ